MVISACPGKARLRLGAMRKAHILVMQGSGYPLRGPLPADFNYNPSNSRMPHPHCGLVVCVN